MVSRADVLNGILAMFDSPEYLEVGVNRGETFFAVEAKRKVAVDPAFEFSTSFEPGCEFHEITSDAYFSQVIDPSQKFDLVYLDGLHTVEQTFRDFTNSIRYLKNWGVIVIDDVKPTSYAASLPDFSDTIRVREFTGDPDKSWMGDVYKLVFLIRAFFPSFNLRTVHDNHGQAVVWPSTRVIEFVPTHTLADISQLQFLDVASQSSTFQIATLSQILSEIRNTLFLAEHNTDAQLTGVRKTPPRVVRRAGEQRTEGTCPVKPLLSLAVSSSQIAPAVRFSMPSALRYDNVGEFDQSLGMHLREQIYCDRVARLDAVEIASVGCAILHSDYMVTVKGVAVAEQVPPWVDPTRGTVCIPAWAGAFDETDAETLIVSRFGWGTWGHWLGELLPKIVMAEAAYPGRFLYAVPAAYSIWDWRTFGESITAYGISTDRLLYVQEKTCHRFVRAWMMTPVWSDRVIHPNAAERMRSALKPMRYVSRSASKIALSRPARDMRQVANWPELADRLRRCGFDVIDIASLSFLNQVETFRPADTVFSILGSGLAGLIYSPAGVRVASVAPSNFGDWFFYGLVTERRGSYSDVRGPVQLLDHQIAHRSSFVVDLDKVELGLAALLP